MQVVKYLVKKGADLSARKDNGRTPLDEAKQLSDLSHKIKEVVDFLSEHQVSQGRGRKGGRGLGRLCLKNQGVHMRSNSYFYHAFFPQENNQTNFSDSESDVSDLEDVDDFARFLGLSNSPSVEQALQALGIQEQQQQQQQQHQQQQQQQQQTNPKRHKVKKFRQRQRQQHQSVVVAATETTSSKARLNFEMESGAGFE